MCIRDRFRDAHTLKGVAGNLGLDPFYTVVSALTEELRSRKYDRLDEFVQDAEENYELLTQIIQMCIRDRYGKAEKSWNWNSPWRFA